MEYDQFVSEFNFLRSTILDLDRKNIIDWQKIGSRFMRSLNYYKYLAGKERALSPKNGEKKEDSICTGFCCVCEEPINSHYKYCSNCGQKIDWSFYTQKTIEDGK